MFSNAKSGDRVWDYLCGWGTIIEINNDDNYIYPLTVEFENEQATYTLNGRKYTEDLNQRLFWEEIKFEIPEKPFDLEAELKRLEIKEFEHGDKNYYLYWDNAGKKIYYDIVGNNEQPNIEYFSEENINNFMKNIRYKKITKEQFFVAYKNVFGGR